MVNKNGQDVEEIRLSDDEEDDDGQQRWATKDRNVRRGVTMGVEHDRRPPALQAAIPEMVKTVLGVAACRASKCRP
jgi:hypothetical protein